MRLPIVYANTAVRVLEIAGANVASLIVIITSSVVIELDLIFLTALKTDRKARKRRLAPSPPPLLPSPLHGFASLFSFLFFFFPHHFLKYLHRPSHLFLIFVTASRKLVPPLFAFVGVIASFNQQVSVIWKAN